MADIKAKRSAVLEALKSELKRGFIDKEVVVSGHKFKLHTLNEDEETWADSLTRSNNVMATFSSRRAPRLAAAISEIDGSKVEELFLYPDDMPPEIKKGFDENPVSKRYWLRDQMLYFLAEDSNRPFISELYDNFEKLEAERDEAIKATKN